MSGGTRGLPSEAEIKAGQAKVIAAAPTTSSASKAAAAARSTRARPSRTTAPASVLELAEAAAGQWLAYRVSGAAPDVGVIPRKVWDGVAPMVPTERVKGAARLGGLTAFSAHPEGDGWIVSVSTQDPRIPTLVVQVDEDKTVSGVSG